MASSSAYYSNEEATILRETDVKSSDLVPVPSDRLEEVYEIERCLRHIREKKYKTVALQFPDSLLVDASNIAWQLEQNCDAKIHILADTSYGHCDVDEVNAKHIDADLVIHYGVTSLTQSATIPTLHIFGQHSTAIDVDKVLNAFRDAFPDPNARVVFLHHVMCDYIADDITSKLLREYPYLSIAELSIPGDPGGTGADNDIGEKEKGGCSGSCSDCPYKSESNGKDTKRKPHNRDQTNTTRSGSTDAPKLTDPRLKTIDSNTPSDVATSNQSHTNTKNATGTNSVPDEPDLMPMEINTNGVQGSNAAVSDLEDVMNGHKEFAGDSMNDLDAEKMELDSHLSVKDYRTGFYSIPLEINKELADYSVFYLGPSDAESFRNFTLRHPTCDIHFYDPSNGYKKMQSNVNRQLMKRYYLVEKAKDAKIVGILVGTMGMARYLQCLNYMKKIAKFAGKKTYTFIMGKLTPEKLANYLEIDIYVLVANPEHSVLDVSNFYRPVVTPYEFEVACNPAREWTGNYITDFRSILPGGSDYVELPPEDSEEQTTVSLVTGKIRTNVDIEDNIAPPSGTISLRNEKTDLAVFGTNSSAHHLSERSWKGLEQKIRETPVTKAKMGRSGIAVSYNEMIDF